MIRYQITESPQLNARRFRSILRNVREMKDWMVERVEFELPVPIEHTDDSVRLSFATLRRLHAQSLLKHRDGAERRGVVRSRLLIHHRGRHNRAELLVTLCVRSHMRLHRLLGISWDLADTAKGESFATRRLIRARRSRQSSWGSSAAAALKSVSAKPSVMLATTGTRPALASSRRLCAARKRARLVAARNSQARAC